jgi:hypothetical protein
MDIDSASERSFSPGKEELRRRTGATPLAGNALAAREQRYAEPWERDDSGFEPTPDLEYDGRVASDSEGEGSEPPPPPLPPAPPLPPGPPPTPAQDALTPPLSGSPMDLGEGRPIDTRAIGHGRLRQRHIRRALKHLREARTW